MKTTERNELKSLGLLESLQTVWHYFRITAANPEHEDPLIAKSRDERGTTRETPSRQGFGVGRDSAHLPGS
ncbi:MAG TPA: hypothetical protein VN753_02485 [Terracidiphilus sp.]|nr:hypothetical protein [Terracidiphilus sp.]